MKTVSQLFTRPLLAYSGTLRAALSDAIDHQASAYRLKGSRPHPREGGLN